MFMPGISREEVIAAHLSDLNFDVSFIACGVMVKECLDAASILETQGIRASVAGFASIKPFDADLCFALARRSRLVVVAEEHSVIGGLGGAVCECLAEVHPVKVLRVGVMDRFGESGSARELLEAYGLTGPSIAEKVQSALK